MEMNEKIAEAFSRLDDLFSFSLPDARTLIASFHDEMQRGLDGETSSLKMIPSFVGRPTGTERGSFLAIDLGGTNLRILAVELDGRGRANITAVSRFVIPETLTHGTGEDLFDFLADGVLLFLNEHGLNGRQHAQLAFTFSFPVAQSAVNAGILLNWTKSFTASNVEGRDVVGLLSDALKRKNIHDITVAALANDTVGTLMAKSYADASCDVGVILGTGTNACYPENTGRIGKYRSESGQREMIVNLEWGNFNRIITNRYDQALDLETSNAGRQRMEKMVSGMYLGELARLVILDLIDQGTLLTPNDRQAFAGAQTVTSEHLSEAAAGADIFPIFGIKGATDRDRETVCRIGCMVATRAARIAGAAIAAVITRMDDRLARPHTVAIDGALFAKYPGFAGYMLDILHELFPDRAENITLCNAADGSGIGAAIIAAVAAKTPAK